MTVNNMNPSNGKKFNIYEYMDDVRRTAVATDLNEYCLGLAGETGEILEIIKKHRYQRKQLDLKHLTEELGDDLFYLCAIMHNYGIDIADCIRMNMEKRAKKYDKRFYRVK